MKNNSVYDAKLVIKRAFILLLIAFPFMLIVATLLSIANVPTWLIFVCTILSGFAIFLLEYVIYTKHKEKKEKQRTSNFDPFKD